MNIGLTILSIASLIFPFYAAAAKNEARVRSAKQPVQVEEKPPMFVLQVGISNYKYYRKLSGVTDVLAMRDLLTGKAYKIPPSNTRTLCDDGTYLKQDKTIGKCDGAATKDVIVKEFETHLIARARDYNKQTGKQAVVLFEFSGHGSQVKDKNGDEKQDGKDETLVTVDSQDAAGKNFDITDDELYELSARLAPFTKNIVYILDSCTSGSATRDLSGDVRGLPARKTDAVPMKRSAQNSRATVEKIKTDAEQTDMLPPGDNYIVLSAARAGELAQQKNVFECDTCKKKLGSYGYLTFYLMQALREATDKTSYRDLMESVKRRVSTDTSGVQNPQIEGDDNLRVFAELSRVKSPGIEISKAENNEITIEAGALQGVTTGTVLDIYSVEDEKIAAAFVVRALSPTRSVAAISTAEKGFKPVRAASAERRDRAILIAPDLGATRLEVLLDGEDAAKLNDRDRELIGAVRQKFAAQANSDLRGVILASGDLRGAAARWDVALLKDDFGKVFPDERRAVPMKSGGAATTASGNFPPDDRQVFYLAGRDFTPLYGFYIDAETAPKEIAAAKTADAIVHLARLRAVGAIANDKSALRRKISITPFLTVNPKCGSDGEVVAERKPLLLNEAKTAYKIGRGARFGLEVANNSDVDLYISLIDIGNDGGIKILAPRNVDGEKEGLKLAARSSKVFYNKGGCKSLWTTSAPDGAETFKVIASTGKTERKAFEFLEQDAISRDDAGAPQSLTGLADWTTAEIKFEINSARATNP